MNWENVDERFTVAIERKGSGRLAFATSWTEGATYRYEGSNVDNSKPLDKSNFRLLSQRDSEPKPVAPPMPKATNMEYPVTLLDGQLVDAGWMMVHGMNSQLVDIIKALLVKSEPCAPEKELPIKNKYDRVIVGKYGTGSCVIDVYRVLDAFPGTAAVEHANKKSLAPGMRGSKGYKQDIEEAIQSLQAELDLINDRENT